MQGKAVQRRPCSKKLSFIYCGNVLFIARIVASGGPTLDSKKDLHICDPERRKTQFSTPKMWTGSAFAAFCSPLTSSCHRPPHSFFAPEFLPSLLLLPFSPSSRPSPRLPPWGTRRRAGEINYGLGGQIKQDISAAAAKW